MNTVGSMEPRAAELLREPEQDSESGLITITFPDAPPATARYRVEGTGRKKTFSFYDVNPDGTIQNEGKNRRFTQAADVKSALAFLTRRPKETMMVTPDGIPRPELTYEGFASTLYNVALGERPDRLKIYVQAQLNRFGKKKGMKHVEDTRALFAYERALAEKAGDTKLVTRLDEFTTQIDGWLADARARTERTVQTLESLQIPERDSFNAYLAGSYFHNGGAYKRVAYAGRQLHHAAMKAFAEGGTLEAALEEYNRLAKTGGGGKSMLDDEHERELFMGALEKDMLATDKLSKSPAQPETEAAEVVTGAQPRAARTSEQVSRTQPDSDLSSAKEAVLSSDGVAQVEEELSRPVTEDTDNQDAQSRRVQERMPSFLGGEGRLPEFEEAENVYMELLNELHALAAAVVESGEEPLQPTEIPSQYIHDALFKKGVPMSTIDPLVAGVESVKDSMNGLMASIFENGLPSRDEQAQFARRLSEFQTALGYVKEANALLSEQPQSPSPETHIVDDDELDELLAAMKRTS